MTSPIYATQGALSAADSTLFPDGGLAATQDSNRIWQIDKTSAITPGTDVLTALPVGRWLATARLPAPWNGVLYVSTTGNDATGARNDESRPYATVQAALNAAQTGDTVWVGPGTFSSGAVSVTWPNTEGVTLRGMGPEATKLTSSSAVSVPTLTIPAGASVVIQNATIQDLEIEKTDTSSTTNACFFADITANPLLAGANGLVMRNVKFTRNAPAGAGAGFYDACSLSQVNRFALINCSGQVRAFNCGEGYIVDCRIFGQGDVFGGLISTWNNPAAGIVTLLNAKQRFVSCTIKGWTANGVTGLQIGGAPNVDFDPGCTVEDGIGLNGTLTRYSASLVPIVSFAGRWSGNLSLTYSGATNAGTFTFDGAKQTSGTNTWSSSSVRQTVSFKGASLLTITPQARIDLDIRGAVYTSFSATIGVNGATVDRDFYSNTVTLDGAGAGTITGIHPWPTGTTIDLVPGHRAAAAPAACCADVLAAIVGPQAATGSLSVAGGIAAVVNVVLRRR